MRLAVVTANFGPRDRAAVKFSIIDCQGIDLGAVFTDAANFFPLFATQITADFCLGPGAGMKLPLIHRKRMRLKKWGCVQRRGQACVSPVLAIEREDARP